VLARVTFTDGEAFEFSAVPQDGEMGYAHLGVNEMRWLAAELALGDSEISAL
jgi:hypothetical protein